MNVATLILTFALGQNVIFVSYLGLVPLTYFFASARRVHITAAVVTVALLMVSTAYSVVQRWILSPFGLWYLEHLVVVTVLVGTTVLLRRLAIELFPYSVRRARRVVPLLVANATVFVVAMMIVDQQWPWWYQPLAALGAGIGLYLAGMMMVAVRYRLDRRRLPTIIRGLPVWYFSAAIVALGFLLLERVFVGVVQ